MAITEKELSFSRKKPRSLGVSLSYRALRLVKRAIGTRRVLSLLLSGDRWLRRFSHETSVEVFGDPWLRDSLGLRSGELTAWIPPNASVLDVGCGIGRWSREIAPRARMVLGVDYDAPAIEIARRMTTASNVEFRVGNVITDLEGLRFDVALLIHLLEHIDDPVEFLTGLHRVADRLIIEVPNFEGDYLNSSRLALGLPFWTDADHVREYTPNLLHAHLEASGWVAREWFARGIGLVAHAIPTATS